LMELAWIYAALSGPLVDRTIFSPATGYFAFVSGWSTPNTLPSVSVQYAR